MSVRDEMAEAMYQAFGGDIARVNFEGAADALMPLVERVAREAAVQGWHAPAGFGTDEDFDAIARRVVGDE